MAGSPAILRIVLDENVLISGSVFRGSSYVVMGLARSGWLHNTVKPGDMITCTGGAAKSGAPAMLSSLIKLGDGRMIKS